MLLEMGTTNQHILGVGLQAGMQAGMQVSMQAHFSRQWG